MRAARAGSLLEFSGSEVSHPDQGTRKDHP